MLSEQNLHQRCEHSYVTRGGVRINKEDLSAFIMQLGLIPNSPAIEACINLHTHQGGRGSPCAVPTVPFDACCHVASICQAEHQKSLRHDDDDNFIEAWVACGGDLKCEGEISLKRVVELVGIVGMPRTSIKEDMAPWDEDELITYRDFLALTYFDDTFLRMLAQNNTSVTIESVMQTTLTSEQASLVRPTIRALMKFKRLLRRIRERKEEERMGERLDEADEHPRMLSHAMHTHGIATNESNGNEPTSGSGVAALKHDTSFDNLTRFSTFRFRKKDPLQIREIKDVNFVSRHDKIVEQVDQMLKQRKKEERKRHLEEIARTHPHRLSMNVVKEYSSKPVLAPVALRKVLKDEHTEFMKNAHSLRSSSSLSPTRSIAVQTNISFLRPSLTPVPSKSPVPEQQKLNNSGKKHSSSVGTNVKKQPKSTTKM